MMLVPKKKLIDFISGAFSMLLLMPGACARGHKDHPYRYSNVDMSISLGIGTIRTPEFPVVAQWYDILLQAEKPLPFRDMQCMMGLKDGTLDFKECTNEPLVEADWTVWKGEHIVSKGLSSGFGAAAFTNKYLFKFLGSFPGEAADKYVVEVKFTKDGSPLNVANPHLIIIQHRYQ
jgi:hypothetical protein